MVCEIFYNIQTPSRGNRLMNYYFLSHRLQFNPLSLLLSLFALTHSVPVTPWLLHMYVFSTYPLIFLSLCPPAFTVATNHEIPTSPPPTANRLERQGLHLNETCFKWDFIGGGYLFYFNSNRAKLFSIASLLLSSNKHDRLKCQFMLWVVTRSQNGEFTVVMECMRNDKTSQSIDVKSRRAALNFQWELDVCNRQFLM